jgi:hypothetical protein
MRTYKGTNDRLLTITHKLLSSPLFYTHILASGCQFGTGAPLVGCLMTVLDNVIKELGDPDFH